MISSGTLTPAVIANENRNACSGSRYPSAVWQQAGSSIAIAAIRAAPMCRGM